MPAPKGHPPYNVNGEGGRPRRFTKEFGDQEADALMEWMEDSDKNMFIEDFCVSRGFSDNKVSQLCQLSERFKSAYELFQSKQKSFLFKGALFKKLSFNMSQFILNVNHNLYAKNEQIISGSNSNPLEVIIGNSDGSSRDLVDESTENS